MRGIIDRIENKIVIIELEDGTMLEVNKKNIKGMCREGKVVELQHECENLLINEYETIERKKYMDILIKDLWN